MRKIPKDLVLVYFILLSFSSLMLVIFGKTTVDIYGAMLMMLGGMPVFMVFYTVFYTDFSNAVRSMFPDIFMQHKLARRGTVMLDPKLVKQENLTRFFPESLNRYYVFARFCMNLAIISFAEAIVWSVVLLVFKR